MILQTKIDSVHTCSIGVACYEVSKGKIRICSEQGDITKMALACGDKLWAFTENGEILQHISIGLDGVPKVILPSTP